MNTSATIKYSLFASLKIISPFYLTLLALLVLNVSLRMATGYTGGMSGWDMLAMFANCGVVSCFKTRFHFFLQNGYSRKTLFMNFLICILGTSIFLSVFDYSITLLNQQGVLGYEAFFTSLYGSQFSALMYLLWHIGLSLGVLSSVFFLTVLFYRISKIWRILMFIILPAVLLVCLPMIEFLIPSLQLFEHMRQSIMWCMGISETLKPYHTVFVGVSSSAICLCATYFILRKVNLQKN